MQKKKAMLVVASALSLATGLTAVAAADGFGGDARGAKQDVADWLDTLFGKKRPKKTNVQLGPRPYFLVDAMEPSPLKTTLNACKEAPAETSDFSIGHRGACLQFPEHTKESYLAGARMGAGILECDVTFTKDRQLVCRHSQCDLHTTTNILAIPELAAKCTQPFSPADPATGKAASANCCTSDITLAEFKSLCGKMDASNPKATSVAEYLGGTATFRTDLYAGCGTLLTHKESIALIDGLGLKFTPELKEPSVTMPFDGDYTQEKYAQQMIDEYKAAGIAPRRVFAQSFRLDDVLYWINKEPAFGRQGVYLDARVDTPEGYDAAVAGMADLAAKGVRIVAPPMFALVKLNAQNRIIPSEYAKAAKSAGLDIITWTFERSGFLTQGGGYYYQYVTPVINDEGDAYKVLDVLAMQVGVRGVFSDWPASVTYYANCMGL
ncbi:MAG TPA: glycerophosphodiester phosphodiesterase family protein [Polyangiales bacterium]